MELRNTIEKAYEKRQTLTPENVDPGTENAIHEAIELLDSGRMRIAEKHNDTWIVNEWLKQAVLLYFCIRSNQIFETPITRYYDKVPLKFQDMDDERITEMGVRVVPTATVRKGAFVGKNTVLMPSYINIGAFVDSGCMIDTWATVGSCAQIGKNVHLSGGAGIGGVLEPLQASPTIIEDDCFIGARSEIVEGMIVEKGSVISMGVFLGKSTRIYDRETGEIYHGRVPAGSVVVPGNLPSPDGTYSTYAGIIVKKVDAKTHSKTELNELLREFM